MTEMALDGGPVVGEDGLARCPWAGGDSAQPRLPRHRMGSAGPRRGTPCLERITLEAFQSGLSWLTILRKRPGVPGGVRRIRCGLSWPRTPTDDVERLMADTGIVRNRAKILAHAANAQATVELRSGAVSMRSSGRIGPDDRTRRGRSPTCTPRRRRPGRWRRTSGRTGSCSWARPPRGR